MTLQNALGDIALDATLTDGTQKAQLVDAGGTAVDVTAANALKVDGSAVTQPVSGPLTDVQLRATSVPVTISDGSGPVTVDGTVAIAGGVAVTGAVTTDALTDAELRAAAVPVSAAALPLPAGAATEASLGGLASDTSAILVHEATIASDTADIRTAVDGHTAYLNNIDASTEGIHTTLDAVINETPGFEKMVVGTVSGRIAANFAGASMPQDGFTVMATGSGHTVALDGAANGARYLKLSSGTTINTSTIVQSDELVTLPLRLNCQVSLSQRIVNQEFYLELAGVDGSGVVQEDSLGPLDWIAIKWDSTTAANAVVVTRSGGGSIATSAAAAFGTTAATGSTPNFIPAFVYDILAYAERVVVSGYAVDALTAPGATIARVTALPDPLIQYRVRFRVKNLGSAPASSTDFRIHQLRAIDQTRFTTEITGGVGRAADAQSSVPVVGTVALSGGTTAVTGSLTSAGTATTTPANPTASTINSGASTNATSVKASAGNLYSITASNINAAVRYLKIYNKASAPTVGTDVPVITIPIPAGGVVNIPFGTQGMRLGTGIALAITTGAADSDTGAVAANEIKVMTSYI